MCTLLIFSSLPSTSKLLWLSLSLKPCDLILCSGNPISLQRWASMLSSNAIPQNHWQHAGPEKHFQRQRKTKEMGSHWLIVGAELGKEHLEPLKDPLTPCRKILWADRCVSHFTVKTEILSVQYTASWETAFGPVGSVLSLICNGAQQRRHTFSVFSHSFSSEIIKYSSIRRLDPKKG